jgi:hypothetical protein
MRLLAMVLALLLSVSAAHADPPRQFNNVIYTPPTGWTGGYATGPWIMLIPEDPNTTYCQGCFFYIGTGAVGVSDAVAYLTTQTLTFVDPAKHDLVTINQSPSAVLAAGRPGAMMATNFDGRLLLTVAVTLGDRIELFGFEGPAADQAQAAATLAVFAKEFEPFVASLKFVSEGAKPLLPAPKPGPLAGLWWGWKTIWVPTMDFQMRMELQHRLIVFWPDGTFYDGTPQRGLALPDRTVLQGSGDLKFGTYSVSGSRLKLTYANGVSATMPLIVTVIMDDERKLNPVEVFPDGTTIDGRLTSNFYGAFNPFAGMSGGATSMSEVLFFPDGHWESSSFAAASGNFTDVLTGQATGTFSSSSGIDSQHGTYVVKDGVVVRSPADGGPAVVSFIFSDPDGNILIGDQILEPRE